MYGTGVSTECARGGPWNALTSKCTQYAVRGFWHQESLTVTESENVSEYMYCIPGGRRRIRIVSALPSQLILPWRVGRGPCLHARNSLVLIEYVLNFRCGRQPWRSARRPTGPFACRCLSRATELAPVGVTASGYATESFDYVAHKLKRLCFAYQRGIVLSLPNYMVNRSVLDALVPLRSI